MAIRSKFERRGRIETLEARQLLAGDVLVNVVNGNLSLVGDAEANNILISAGAEAGAYVITGLDTMLDSGPDPVTVTGVRNIRVDLGAGDDLIAIAGASVRGNVSIKTGEDADRVFIGTGADAAELVDELPDDLSVAIRGKLKINTDGGPDRVSIDDAVLSSAHIETGDDVDLISLGSSAALGDLDARVAVSGSVHVHLGEGSDEFQADQVRSRFGVFVSAGEGDDTIEANAVAGGGLLVLGDGGMDGVTVVDSDLRALGIHTGDGNDTAEVRDSVFGAIGVFLGEDSDTLTTANLEAKLAWFAGGDGDDTLDNSVASVFEHERIVGFESPPDVNTAAPAGRKFLGRLLRGRLR